VTSEVFALYKVLINFVNTKKAKIILSCLLILIGNKKKTLQEKGKEY